MIEKSHGGVPAMRTGEVATELNLSQYKLPKTTDPQEEVLFAINKGPNNDV